MRIRAKPKPPPKTRQSDSRPVRLPLLVSRFDRNSDLINPFCAPRCNGSRSWAIADNALETSTTVMLLWDGLIEH